MDLEKIKLAGEVFGTIASGLAVTYGITRLITWIKNKRAERRRRKVEILEGIKRLCQGQNEIWEYLKEMNELRAKAREEDAVIRGNQYLGQIAVIAAIKELAKAQGIPINGEVQKYYEANIDSLRVSFGMTPLHVKKEADDHTLEINKTTLA